MKQNNGVKNKDNKKAIILTIIALFVFLFLIIGTTYAYFSGFIGGGSNAGINATTGTTDSLTFIAGDPIRIHATEDNFKEGMNSLNGKTTATAKLMPNNSTYEASGRYNVFFVIEENDFKYTSEDGQAELIFKITDPNGNEVTNIPSLKRIENGFDITTRSGAYLIISDYDIKTNSKEGIEQKWNFEVTLVNLDDNQDANRGKQLNGYVYITTEKIGTYDAPNINSVLPKVTYNSIETELNVLVGTEEIDKYYYAIEEKQTGLALNEFKVKQMNNKIAIKEEDYKESDTINFTFENLKENTTYIIYSYAVDKQGVKSNVYQTEITTGEYVLPKVKSITHTSTLNSITVTATGENGTGEINKYYYSKDNGESWEVSTSNTFTFNNLLDTTEYKIKVKVSDGNDRFSTDYYEVIETEKYINPSITTVKTKSKNWNSITLDVTAVGGSNNVAKYYFSKDNGATWSEGKTSNSYTVTGLDDNKEYNILVKVEDTNGRFSNIYDSYKETTNTYKLPTITAEVLDITANHFKINATATKGDGDIKEYWYSKDGGSNWEKVPSSSLTNSYVFDELTSETSFSIKVKAIDENNRESNSYQLNVTTLTNIEVLSVELQKSNNGNYEYYGEKIRVEVQVKNNMDMATLLDQGLDGGDKVYFGTGSRSPEIDANSVQTFILEYYFTVDNEVLLSPILKLVYMDASSYLLKEFSFVLPEIKIAQGGGGDGPAAPDI